MATIKDTLLNFESLNLRNEVPKIVRSRSSEMVDYNLDQVSKGLTSEGKIITPEYKNTEYAAFKASKGSKSPFGVPDLKLTGDLYAGWRVDFQSLSFTFSSSDAKSVLIEGKYSANGGIFGLSQENKSNLSQNEIKPDIIAYIEAKTGIGLS